MSDMAIRTEDIGKSYVLGEGLRAANFRKNLRLNLRETISERFLKLTRPFARGAVRLDAELPNKLIWALRHVSVEIKAGELVGIVGANGSGKTTFLRILARIVFPTQGVAEIRGSMGTLLDVGAGFHGELTGRENIRLNGSLLGMSRVAMERKFDVIVAFAELEKFIDTPLKYYSSGMCVRLAFAIAAHLESEIFLVDEALAVADAPFQRRCLEKMITVGREGRTVMLVSHDLELIRLVCGRVLVFAGGCVVYTGPTTDALDYYCAPLVPVSGLEQLCATRPQQ
jgi:lipopolysaccharide transport system ATP-binding protein